MTIHFKYVDLLFRSQSGKKNKPKGAINQIDREKKSSIKKAWTTANVEDTTTFCNEFSKTLEYLYFSDPWDEKEFGFNINFAIWDFNEQTTIPTDNNQNALFAFFKTQSSIEDGALFWI